MKLIPILVAVQAVGTLGIGGVYVAQSMKAAAPEKALKADAHPGAHEAPPAHEGAPKAEGEGGHEAAPAEHQEAAHELTAKEKEAALAARETNGHEKEKPKDKEKTCACKCPEVEETASDVVTKLFEGNQRFVSGQVNAHDFNSERKSLAGHQSPKVMVLSCSDSRLPPELVFDQTLGDLFVVRSAGNVADKVGLASMEYAAEHLHASVLLVLGHEKCGAVTAAAKGGKMPSANLEALMADISPSLKVLRTRYEGDDLVHRGVEANVTETAKEVTERSPLLAKLVKEGKLTVVKAVYDLDTGKVRRLDAPATAPVAAAAAEH